MRKDRSLSVCPTLEEGRHRLPALLGREQTLVGCSTLEAESWLPLSLPHKGKGLSATLCLSAEAWGNGLMHPPQCWRPELHYVNLSREKLVLYLC